MTELESKFSIRLTRMNDCCDGDKIVIHNIRGNDIEFVYRSNDFFVNDLIFLSNIRRTPIFESVLQCINETTGKTSKDYLITLLKEFTRLCKYETTAKLMLVDMALQVQSNDSLSIENVKSSLLDNIPGLTYEAESLMTIAYDLDYTDYKARDIIGSFINLYGNTIPNINYSIMSGQNNNKLIFIDVYTFLSGSDTLRFELAEMARNNITVKLCDNCGKFFFPKSRSDEKYCDFIFKNGRTCKQISFDAMVKKDEALRIYRSVYKTQNARLQRNSKGKSDAYKKALQSRFGEWRDNAKNLLQRCRNGEIMIEEMKRSIDDLSWLKGDTTNGKY